jgi:two-component system, LytTR family, sensor kinase
MLGFNHNPLFRLFFPPVYGLLVYVLVLLIFDSIQQLEENFFSEEALLCIGLTYALSESLRLVLLAINRIFPEFRSVQRRIFIYLAANLSCSLLVITLGVSAYFVWVLGYPSFQTELLTLNSIFLVSTVLYTLVYFGIYYLHHFNQRRLEQEKKMREKMEFQVNALKTDVNPQLLYASLETLIQVLHHDPDEADAFIHDLSKIYRYALENKKRDMVPVAAEIEAARNIVKLYNYIHQNRIKLNFKASTIFTELDQKLLLPGTLQKLVEHAINRSLITQHTPLQLYLRLESEQTLSFRYELHERLLISGLNPSPLPELTRAYGFYTDRPLECTQEDNQVAVFIPLLAVAAPASVAVLNA